MKAVKVILGILVAFVVIIGGLSFFSPTEYAIERSVVINKSRAETYNYVKYLKNQDFFSVWAMKDPDMKKTFKGTDATVGFTSAWDSQVEDVGAGEQEILEMVENERIDYELRFTRPMEIKDKANMSFSDEGAGTKVSWGFNGNMARPANAMMALGMINFEELLGPDLQSGLENLKKIVEAIPAPEAVESEDVESEG